MFEVLCERETSCLMTKDVAEDKDGSSLYRRQPVPVAMSQKPLPPGGAAVLAGVTQRREPRPADHI